MVQQTESTETLANEARSTCTNHSRVRKFYSSLSETVLGWVTLYHCENYILTLTNSLSYITTILLTIIYIKTALTYGPSYLFN